MFGGPTFPLFRILGFPIGAHWSLVVAVALMGIAHGGAAGVLLSFLVFASVLAHELGHAVVARRRRVPILGIDLHLFGGVAKMAEPPRSPKDEVAIAIAGPLVSLALAVGLGVTARVLGPEAPGWLFWIAGVNGMLGLFNLLPALPMDGGRVLRAVLAKRSGLVGGTEKAVKVSRAIAVGLAVLGVFTNPWLVAIAVMVWMMGSAELAQMRRHQHLWNLGYRDDAFNPWARYEKASQRERDRARGRPGVLEPEVVDPRGAESDVDERHPAAILAAMMGQPAPAAARRRPGPRAYVVRDAFGRTVVAYRW